MAFTLGLAQTRHPADGDVLALVEHWASRAEKRGVDLLVYPESLMSRFEAEREQFTREAQALDGSFATGVDSIAERFGLWIVYTVNEKNPNGGLPFNTAVLTGPDGIQRGSYRKVHMFDSHTTCESERMSAGDALFGPVQTPLAKIGLGICYDLRFPEVARSAALDGCELFVLPAAWVDGPRKREQWATLLGARAVENEMFVAGVSRCDESYVGSSMVVAPNGDVLACGGRDEELLVCDIDLDVLATMRSQIPVFDHRRPEVYGK